MYPLKVSRKLVVFLAASLALMIGTGTTFSLLKVKANVITNQFTSAKVNVQVVEILPGQTNQKQGSDSNNTMDFGNIRKDIPISKSVSIQNVNSEKYPTTDTFVRCRVVPILRDAENHNIATEIVVEINDNNQPGMGWEAEDIDGERYYYWKEILMPDEETTPLFYSVTVRGQEIPEDAHLELQVLVDAVQARPFPTAAFNLMNEKDREEAGKKIPSYSAWGWYYDGSFLSRNFYDK